jgi:hypothetical protein
MKIYIKQFNARIGQFEQLVFDIDVNFKSSVDTSLDLPISNNVYGDVRMVLDTDHLYAYINNQWVDQGVFDIGDLIQANLMQALS